MSPIIDFVLQPVRTYLDVTIYRPVNDIRDLEAQKPQMSSKTGNSSPSLRQMMRKQKAMCSPEIPNTPYRSALGVREHYLNSLSQASGVTVRHTQV